MLEDVPCPIEPRTVRNADPLRRHELHEGVAAEIEAVGVAANRISPAQHLPVTMVPGTVSACATNDCYRER
jgi:hypothetical protein